MKNSLTMQDLNPGPLDRKTSALPIELLRQMGIAGILLTKAIQFYLLIYRRDDFPC